MQCDKSVTLSDFSKIVKNDENEKSPILRAFSRCRLSDSNQRPNHYESYLVHFLWFSVMTVNDEKSPISRAIFDFSIMDGVGW